MTNPSLPPPTSPEVSQLQILSIFYYILAALQGLVACVGLLYIGIGVVVAVLGIGSARQSGDAAAAGVFGGFFACIGIAVILLVGTFAFLYFKAAQGLRHQKSYTLCLIMAIIVCLNIPLGTILGIFTIIALNKPNAKALFK